jgi:hypothetical protein
VGNGDIGRYPPSWQANTHMGLRCGFKVRFIVSTNDGYVPTRLYVQSPELPASLDSINVGGGVRLGELMKFVKAVTELESIKPRFLESNAVLSYALTQKRRENDGETKLTLISLPDAVKSWLARKGFDEDDMQKLEQIAGGITAGILHQKPTEPEIPR